MKAIYKFPDGRVAVVSFPPGITDLVLVPDEAIPADRTFRDAWTHTGDGVAVDMTKAREIYRNRVGLEDSAINAAIDAAATPEELLAIDAEPIK